MNEIEKGKRLARKYNDNLRAKGRYDIEWRVSADGNLYLSGTAKQQKRMDLGE